MASACALDPKAVIEASYRRGRTRSKEWNLPVNLSRETESSKKPGIFLILLTLTSVPTTSGCYRILPMKQSIRRVLCASLFRQQSRKGFKTIVHAGGSWNSARNIEVAVEVLGADREDTSRAYNSRG